jgi:hypothetical protein
MIKLLWDGRIAGRMSTRREIGGQARHVSVHSFRFVLFWLRGFCDGFHLLHHARFVLFRNSPKSFASFVVAKQDALASRNIHMWAYYSLRNVALCFNKRPLHSSMVTAFYRMTDPFSPHQLTAAHHPLLNHQSHLKKFRPKLLPNFSSVGSIAIENVVTQKFTKPEVHRSIADPIPRPANTTHVFCSQDADADTLMSVSYISKLQETSL